MATSEENAAHRSVIKYCVERGMTPGQTITEMETSASHRGVSRALIYKWHKRFTTGWTESNAKKGRRKEIHSAIIKKVSDVIDADRRHTVREVAEIVGISKSSAHKIISDELGMSRVCARWVPRLLRDEEMKRRVSDSNRFLSRVRRDQVVRRDLMRAIRKKRPGMADELENVVYHHDNAPPHKAASTELELAILGFQRIAHSPYSPDLAPLDFAYFPALNDYLRGRKYADTDEVKHAILSFNRSLSPQWFKDTFTRWVRRHEKCIEHQGQYFEKL